jgi:ligand-binding sensor domain-containing protein
MNTRSCTVISALLAAAAISHAEPGDVSWELLRPSNTGIPGDYTQTIFIDDDDSPWIAGYVTFWEEGGMAHHDGTNWRVLGNVDCPQIASPRFNDIVKTDDGIMWIGSDQGLLRFDPSVEPWCVTRYHTGNSGIAANSINNIDIAPDGTLWLACDTVGGSSQGGLTQYDPISNTWNSWDTSNGLPWWSGWDWVDYLAVQPDAGGGYTVWFGSSEMGMTSYKDGLFIWYGSPTPPPGSPRPTGIAGKHATQPNGDVLMTTTQGLAFRHPDGTYTIVGSAPVGGTSVSIVEPISNNRVLLGTYGADVYLWDEGSWNSLGNWGSGNHTYTLTEDSKGSIWAGGIGGSSKYENGQWQRFRLTNTGMLDFFSRDVTLAPNGDVAMTANAGPGVGGFDIMHANRTWTNANIATYGLGLPWPYPTDNTSAVAFRENNNLLFAPTNNGLHEYDGVGFTPLVSATYDFEHINFTKNGRGWATTGRAVAFMEQDDGSWQQFGYADGLPVGDICAVVPDPIDPDSIWIAAQFGAVKTDGVTWDLVPREAIGLDRDSTGYHFWSFDVADDGTLWIGSGMGLYHYDPATGLYDQYNTTNSSIPSDDIHNVEVAPDGSVWISMFDQIFPYPGGVSQLKDGTWRNWSQGSSPLPHNQIWDLESRTTPDGYEMWVVCASEAIAIMRVEGEGTQPCIADFTGDGVLDFFDVSAFLNAFNAEDPIADLTGDGVFNFFDVSAFLNAFGAGCP